MNKEREIRRLFLLAVPRDDCLLTVAFETYLLAPAHGRGLPRTDARNGRGGASHRWEGWDSRPWERWDSHFLRRYPSHRREGWYASSGQLSARP